MADEELSKIVVDLRKFRKKLRQIEKLEELERDLTDEEFFKLSKKDEIRSTVQQLVAREEELKSKLQDMERNQDEQVLAEQEEQTRREETQDQVQSTGVGPQEVVNENAQTETELTINEIYDQAPVVEPSSADAIPDIVPTTTTTTRTAPILSSTQTYMRFQVRNLQGHNDLICGVDCRGSVLVSGRGNYLLEGCVKRESAKEKKKRICKRKHMIEQSRDQGLGENDSRTEAKKKRAVQRAGSSMVARSQKTDKEMVASLRPQSHGEFGKREVAVIPQNLLVDQNYKRHCSDSSIKAKNPRLDKSICSGEYLQPLAESRRHEGFAIITEVDDVTKDTCEPLASKEPSHVCIDIEKKLKNPTPSSHTFGEDHLSLHNKETETLQSGDEQQQSAAIKGSAPVRRNIVIQTHELFSVFSGEENLESYESVPMELQQVEIKAKKQTPGVNGSDVGEVVVDKGEEVASESGNVVTHQSVELQANKQTPGVKENEHEEIAVVPNQAVESENGNVLTQQPVELEANKQTPCVNENAVGEIAVDQNQPVTSESFNVVASEHQQVEIKESSNQMPGVNESDVSESAVDPKEAISTESINVFTSAGQQVEKEASNQKTGNGSDDGEFIVDQRTSVASESFNVVTSERQQLEIEASYQSSDVNESGGGAGGVDQREAVASAESFNVVTSELQKVEIDAHNQAACVNENDVGETVVDPGEAVLTESITVGTSDGKQFEIEGCNQTTGVNNGSDIGENSVDQGEAVSSGSVNAVTSKHQQLEIEAINEIDVEEIVDQNQAVASKSFNVVSSQHKQLEIEVDSTDHSTIIHPSFSTRKSDSKDGFLDKQKSVAQGRNSGLVGFINGEVILLL